MSRDMGIDKRFYWMVFIMLRKGRMDLNVIMMMIIAVVIVALISLVVFDVTAEGKDQGDSIIGPIECDARIATVCTDGIVKEHEIDGRCITESNRDNLC